jgi:hypothetical protein
MRFAAYKEALCALCIIIIFAYLPTLSVGEKGK